MLENILKNCTLYGKQSEKLYSVMENFLKSCTLSGKLSEKLYYAWKIFWKSVLFMENFLKTFWKTVLCNEIFFEKLYFFWKLVLWIINILKNFLKKFALSGWCPVPCSWVDTAWYPQSRRAVTSWQKNITVSFQRCRFRILFCPMFKKTQIFFLSLRIFFFSHQN